MRRSWNKRNRKSGRGGGGRAPGTGSGNRARGPPKQDVAVAAANTGLDEKSIAILALEKEYSAAEFEEAKLELIEQAAADRAEKRSGDVANALRAGYLEDIEANLPPIGAYVIRATLDKESEEDKKDRISMERDLWKDACKAETAHS